MLTWSILFVLFSLIEVAVPALVSVWFALASICMMFISIFIKDIYVQFLIFTILSAFFIITLRAYCKKFLDNRKAISLEEVLVVSLEKEESNGIYIYNVKYKGSIWTGISKEKIAENTVALIKAFDGNKIELQTIK